MDEARRFLRFVVPGALFGFETGVLISLFRPDWITVGFVAVKQSNGLIAASGALFGSAVLPSPRLQPAAAQVERRG